MFADTRYLPVPSLPGPPLGSSCHGSLQRFKGAICFSRSCLHNGYLPHRGQMHRDRRGPGHLKYKSPRCKAFICDYTSLIFFIFYYSTCRALLHSSLSRDGTISTNKVGLFVVCLFVFLSAAANACNYEKRGERDTYLVCVHVCACRGEEVIKENIPQGGSIAVIQSCMGPSVGSTDTVLRVCRLY